MPPRSCHTAPMSTQEIAIPAVPGLPDARTATKYYTDLARTAGSPNEQLGEGERAESVAERDARRLDERLPGYRPTPASELSFDPRIAYEIALGVDSPTAVFAKYGIAESHAVKLATNEAFGATLRKYKEEISASGISFKLKAKIQAEDLLTHSYLMATDPEVPPAVRADLIKWTARVAGLEPKEKDGGAGGAGGFTLNISFAGEPAAAAVGGRVIEGAVVGEE